MTDVSNVESEKPTDVFSALSFERKLVELIEELRLRRNLESESEKTLKSVMDEKYTEELNWEEQQRRYTREREELEQQIDLLKRKLEDKVCVSDDEKAKQQIMNKTYSHELRMLKEELRVSKSEKLNLQKKVQELEGKLNLHNNFQESIMSQVSDVRKMMKTILDESKELSAVQMNVMENVATAKLMFKKYDLCNQHLQQSMAIMGKKNEVLKKELISSRSEITILKHSSPREQEKCSNNLEVEKLQGKLLDLEGLLLLSRRENEKTLNNFLESNKLLCKFMDKYSEIQKSQGQFAKEHAMLKEKLCDTEKKLQETQDEMTKKDELAELEKRKMIENQHSMETQTDNLVAECFSSYSSMKENVQFGSIVTSDLTYPLIEGMTENALNENPMARNYIDDISSPNKYSNLSQKKITFSEVLKRKIEVLESGNKVEMILMKRRFTENEKPTYSDENTDNENQLLSTGMINKS